MKLKKKRVEAEEELRLIIERGQALAGLVVEDNRSKRDSGTYNDSSDWTSYIQASTGWIADAESALAAIFPGTKELNCFKIPQSKGGIPLPDLLHRAGRLKDRLLELVAALEKIKQTDLPTYEQPYFYDLAISYAGEDRPIAQQIAEGVEKQDFKVFYDRNPNQKRDLLGADLYGHLFGVYEGQARYDLLIASKHYVGKFWTTHELKSALSGFYRRKGAHLLVLRLDDTPVPDLPSTIPYQDIRTNTLEEIIDLYCQRLRV